MLKKTFMDKQKEDHLIVEKQDENSWMMSKNSDTNYNVQTVFNKVILYADFMHTTELYNRRANSQIHFLPSLHYI